MHNFIFNVLRSSLGIMFSRVFGLLRDIVIATVYGASGLTDMFFVAFAIPNLFRQFFVEGAMTSAFMPFLAEKFKTGGKQAQNAYITQLILIQSFFVFIICVLIMIFASYVLKVFLPGYSGDSALFELGVSMLRIVMPFLLFITICGMLSGYINSYGGFFITYASSAIFNIAMIAGAWFGYMNTANIKYLAYGAVAGGAIQLLLIYVASYIYGYRPSISLKIQESVKKTYMLLVPSVAGVGVSQLNFLIGRILASYLAQGSISFLFYANRLFQFPLGVFSVAIGSVSLASLSHARANEDLELRNSLITKALLSIWTIILPATIGLVGLSYEIVSLIYERDAFTRLDAINTASALTMYSLGLIFFSLVNVLTRVFHADKNTKTPVLCAFYGFIVNLVLNLLLMNVLGHIGIALASSIAAGVNALLLYVYLKDYKFPFSDNMHLIIKIIFASIGMLIAMLYMKHTDVHVLINILVCIVVYFIMLLLFKINIIRILR